MQLDERAMANLEVALEKVCPHGGDHESRKHVARKLMQSARKGSTTLGALTAVAKTSFQGWRWPGPAERNIGVDDVRLRNLAAPASSRRVRLVPEELAIASRRFGVLVDCHQDRLNVVIAPPLLHPYPSDFGQGLDERGMLRLIAEVLPHVDPGVRLPTTSSSEEIA